MHRMCSLLGVFFCAAISLTWSRSSCRFVGADIATGTELPVLDSYERVYVCADAQLARLNVESRIARIRVVNSTFTRPVLLTTYANLQEDLRVFEVHDSRVHLSSANMTKTKTNEVNLSFDHARSVVFERIALVNLSCTSSCSFTVSAALLPNLRSLSLRGVNLTGATGGVLLQGLPLLSVLEIQQSGLRSFDTSLFDAVTRDAPVSFLLLASNGLQSIKVSRSWLLYLRVLDVSVNNLPPYSFVQMLNDTANHTLQALRSVRASGNRLVDLDVEVLVNSSRNLETLDVAFNALSGFFTLPHCDFLLELNVSNNAITRLPLLGSTPRGCESLQTLDLSHNQLRRLDALFCSNSALEQRNVASDNQNFASVPVPCSYKVLRRLSVAYNWIEVVAESFVKSIGSSNLRELDLRGNRIAMFSPDRHLSFKSCAIINVLLDGNEQLIRSGLVAYHKCVPVYFATTDASTISASTTSPTLTYNESALTTLVPHEYEQSTATTDLSSYSQSSSKLSTLLSTLVNAGTAVTSLSYPSRAQSTAPLSREMTAQSIRSASVTVASLDGLNDQLNLNLNHSTASLSSLSVTISAHVSHSSAAPSPSSSSSPSPSRTTSDSSEHGATNSNSYSYLDWSTGSAKASASPIPTRPTDLLVSETLTTITTESHKLVTDARALSTNLQPHSSITRSIMANYADLLFAVCVALFCCLLLSFCIVMLLGFRLRHVKREARLLGLTAHARGMKDSNNVREKARPKPYAYAQLDQSTNDSTNTALPLGHILVDQSDDVDSTRRLVRLCRNHSDPLRNGDSNLAKKAIAIDVDVSKDERRCTENEYVSQAKLLAGSNLSACNILLALPSEIQRSERSSRAESEVELGSTLNRYPSEFWELPNDKTETDL